MKDMTPNLSQRTKEIIYKWRPVGSYGKLELLIVEALRQTREEALEESMKPCVYKYQLALAREGLEKIASRWFPPDEVHGACIADCEANLPMGTQHHKDCPFQIAQQTLAKLGDSK